VEFGPVEKVIKGFLVFFVKTSPRRVVPEDIFLLEGNKIIYVRKWGNWIGGDIFLYRAYISL